MSPSDVNLHVKEGSSNLRGKHSNSYSNLELLLFYEFVFDF